MITQSQLSEKLKDYSSITRLEIYEVQWGMFRVFIEGKGWDKRDVTDFFDTISFDEVQLLKMKFQGK